MVVRRGPPPPLEPHLPFPALARPEVLAGPADDRLTSQHRLTAGESTPSLLDPSLSVRQVGNLLSDAFDPQSWQTKRLLYETEEGDGEAALIDHLLSHLSSPLWPTQVSAIARAYS